MEILTIIFSLLVGFLAAVLLIKRKKPDSSEGSFLFIQNQLNEMTRTIDQRLNETHRNFYDSMRGQVGESSKLVRDITERLTKLDETNRQVVGFADQLQSLQDILKNPKQRGILGEYYLETVLKNVLPPGQFEIQYKFQNGDIVDAVVFLGDKKILPVDSKFSLENYNRILESRDNEEKERLEKIFKQDLKNRIDETSKYIRPSENTMDFAFMFIPSEAIYYDLLINQVGSIKSTTRDLIEYAFRDKKVIIVSPTSFMAYLQTVIQGLRAMRIEESAKDIMKRVEDLGRHIKSYDEFMLSLGVSLGTTVNKYNKAYKELKKIDKDVARVTGEAIGIEPALIESPNVEVLEN